MFVGTRCFTRSAVQALLGSDDIYGRVGRRAVSSAGLALKLPRQVEHQLVGPAPFLGEALKRLREGEVMPRPASVGLLQPFADLGDATLQPTGGNHEISPRHRIRRVEFRRLSQILLRLLQSLPEKLPAL